MIFHPAPAFAERETFLPDALHEGAETSFLEIE